MPTVALNVIDTRHEGDGGQPHREVGPLFRGTGDTDYQCGNCGFVIASAIGPAQRVPFDRASCPACGATNEFPPELRG